MTSLSGSKSKWICTIGEPSQLDEYITKGHIKGVLAPRFAFVGRSNVGKSTLLNALAETSLAQVSKQPGKTRLLHFYHVPSLNLVLTDLPGYGYARVEREKMDTWKKLISAYVKKDDRLKGVLLLWDSRHGPSEQDVDAFHYFSSLGISVIIVMTKFDELKTQSDRARRKKELATAFRELGLLDQEPYWVSVTKKMGVKDLANVLVSLAD